MSLYPYVGSRLFNTPLLLRPEKCEIVVAALMDHFGVAKLNRIDGVSLGVVELKQQAMDGLDDEPAVRASRFYDVVEGVAIIPVQGSLMQRVGGIDPYSGAVGYNQIDRKVTEASRDPMVRCILLDIDSPGGEVAGCFDLARKISLLSRRSGGKPIIGAANEQACSAGYAIASACDEIYMPETGMVGSIGVWTMLADLTRAMDKDGVEITMIRAGDRKARGGPYERADKATFAKLQAWVEDTRVQFAQMVAANRNIPADDVLAQEGDWFTGDEAMKMGLIDGIGSFEAIFNRAKSLAI